MKEPFERIDDVEIVELAEILKKIRSRDVNDAGSVFIAQLMGMRRLVVSQHDASQQLMKDQSRGHQEMLREQQSLIRWQKFSTIATVVMVIFTGMYVYETHSIVGENRKMTIAAQEQLELAKQQIRDAGRPMLHLDLDSQEFTITGDVLKSRSGSELRFFVANKSMPPAYNLRCGIRLLRARKIMATIPAPCGRDTLFNNHAESFEVTLSRAQLISVADNKLESAGVEAFVSYEDSPKSGNKYLSIRRAHLREIKDDAIRIRALAFETRQLPQLSGRGDR